MLLPSLLSNSHCVKALNRCRLHVPMKLSNSTVNSVQINRHLDFTRKDIKILTKCKKIKAEQDLML